MSWLAVAAQGFPPAPCLFYYLIASFALLAVGIEEITQEKLA
jgi:hypothetical protein